MREHFIISRGSTECICAAVIYTHLVELTRKDVIKKIIFTENIETEQIIIDEIGKKRTGVVYTIIQLDINRNIEYIRKLMEHNKVLILTNITTKAIGLPLIQENISQYIANPDETVARLALSLLQTYIHMYNIDYDLVFDEYLANIGDLSKQKLNFQDYPALKDDTLKIIKSLVLKPEDNIFRTYVYLELCKRKYIPEIPALMERAAIVQRISNKILANTKQHMKYQTDNIVLYMYNDNDIIEVDGKTYTMRGRFSGVATQLAILHKKLCIIIVKKEQGSYIVLRKYKQKPYNLLKIAEYIKESLDLNADARLDGIYYAATLDIAKPTSNRNIKRVVAAINTKLKESRDFII